MEIKGRRELFCREYLKDLNATQAALRAGYPPSDARTYASRMMAEEEIQARVSELAAGRNEELNISAKDVLLELLRLLTADLAQAFNDDGSLKPIHEIPIDCRRAIASAESEELFEGRGKDRAHIGTLRKVKFWSKDRAIEMLARHLALFKDSIGDGLTDLAKAISEARSRGPLV
jgi:phage terminase small subunit